MAAGINYTLTVNRTAVLKSTVSGAFNAFKVLHFVKTHSAPSSQTQALKKHIEISESLLSWCAVNPGGGARMAEALD